MFFFIFFNNLFCINKKRLIFVKEITTKKNNIMKKLSQKMSLENRMILLNDKTEMSNFLLYSLDNKISWTELTLKDCFYLSQLFDLELNIEKINTFFNN